MFIRIFCILMGLLIFSSVYLVNFRLSSVRQQAMAQFPSFIHTEHRATVFINPNLHVYLGDIEKPSVTPYVVGSSTQNSTGSGKSGAAGKIIIGLVQPTFTAAAYNTDGFYYFYFKHLYENFKRTNVTSDLNMLTSKIPVNHTEQRAAVFINPNLHVYQRLNKPGEPTIVLPPANSNPLQSKYNGHTEILITSHLRQSLPNDQIVVITDKDVHYNRINGFDVLMLFHQEYVTQQEYDNLRNFVANGGTLVVFDGNVFMAEVSYNADNDSVTLVSGHTWQYNGRYASLGPIERWTSETAEWMGSNYYYTTPNVTFHNNPFGYHHGEEQVVTTDPRNIKTIMDYQAVNSNPAFYGEPFVPADRPITTTHPLVATYVKDYGRGRVIVLGLEGDEIIKNPAFLQFFDTVLMEYALGHEITPSQPQVIKPIAR